MTTPDAPAEPQSSGLARWQALAIGAAIVVGGVVYAAGVLAVDVLIQGAADGVVLLLWLLAGYGYGQAILNAICSGPLSRCTQRERARVRASVENDRNSPFALTLTLSHEYTGEGTRGLLAISAIALGLGLMSLLTLGLGLAGLLNNITAWAMLGLGLAIAAYFARHLSLRDLGPWLKTRTNTASVSLLFAIPLAVAFIAASISPGFLWKPLDPHPYDVLSYHLQIPREWFDAGRITPLLHNSFSFFPMGMEMHYLAAMHLLGGPWKAMYLCQFMSLAHGILTVLAVIAICRSMGVGPIVSRFAGLMTAGLPWVLMLSSVCYVEPGVMLYTLLAAAWAMRGLEELSREETPNAAAQAADSSDETKNPRLAPRRLGHLNGPTLSLALAGAFAGFACGMKYTAVPMTAVPLLILWPLFAWRGNGLKRLIIPWTVAGVACAIAFAPWLIRNTAWSGNPIFPLAANILGAGHFTPDEVDRYSLAHQPPINERSLAARLHAGYNRILADPEFGYLIVPLTILAAIVLRRSRTAAFLATILLAMSLVWLLATHVMPRFLTPAIPLAAVLVGLAIHHAKLKAAIWTGMLAMAAQAAIGIVWTWNTLAGMLPTARQGLFRLADLTIIETPETQAARTSGDRVALIGDAQAFFYVVPSSRLLYHGVFDVNVPPGMTTADAWDGKSIDALRAEGYWVVVNTSELDRLTRTYAHLPRPAPPFDAVFGDACRVATDGAFLTPHRPAEAGLPWGFHCVVPDNPALLGVVAALLTQLRWVVRPIHRTRSDPRVPLATTSLAPGAKSLRCLCQIHPKP